MAKRRRKGNDDTSTGKGRQDTGSHRIIRVHSVNLDDFIPETIRDMSRQHRVDTLEEAAQVAVTLLSRAASVASMLLLPGWQQTFQDSAEILDDRVLRPIRESRRR